MRQAVSIQRRGLWARVTAWCCVVAACLSVGGLSAATLTASFNTPSLKVGQMALLTLTCEGGTPALPPELPPLVGALSIRSGQSTRWQSINGVATIAVSYNFQVTPHHPGDLTIPAVAAVVNGQRITSKPLTIKVLAPDPADSLRERAEKGDAQAQYDLGLMYDKGRGVPKDEAEAVKWYQKAADQGIADAQNRLGVIYDEGMGVPKDEGEAVKWYRRAADQGNASAQYNMGFMYDNGRGVPKDGAEAVKWFRKAADQGNALAQTNLGLNYAFGLGVPKDHAEAVKWYRKAAEQGIALAQFNLGYMYANGEGVPKDHTEAVKWYRKVADQGDALAQTNLGLLYANGLGVPKDEVEAYKWFLLAGAQGHENSEQRINLIERRLTASQRAEGQRLARAFTPRTESSQTEPILRGSISEDRPSATGTGFFITTDGYLVSNEHVVSDGQRVRVLTRQGTVSARVVKVDRANDLALLKVEGQFPALPVVASRGVRLGSTVATVGFPNIGLQGFSPKLARGEIASLAGAQDDARHFQISAPMQPGNSGGALFDERGNVVGVVVGKLSQEAALAATGTLAENVNYAIKSSYLLSFLESVPEVAARLKNPHTTDRKFEDVVTAVEQATVLVLVY